MALSSDNGKEMDVSTSLLQIRADETFETLLDSNQLLAQAARRFEQLYQLLPVACFCFNTEGRIVEWNRACETLFRQATAQAILRPVWDIIGRAEDRDLVRALVEGVINDHAYEDLDWEDVSPSGERRYFLSYSFPLHGDQGQVVGGISVSVDVSEQTRMQHALWEKEERWQLALRGNNDGIWDWNVQTGTLFVSERWREILCYDTQEFPSTQQINDLPHSWFARVHPDDRAAAAQVFRQHLDRHTDSYASEHRVQCHDGTYKWVLDRAQGLWDKSGGLTRLAGSFTDITQRKKSEHLLEEANRQLAESNARLQTLAMRDGLTELYNHRAFQERLESEFAQAMRQGMPLSLLLLDVDHFKQYNDAYGHPQGDDVLKTVASILEREARRNDSVARYGGEEFAIILPQAEPEGALLIAERLRQAIAGHHWPQRSVTMSIGAATLSACKQSRAALIGEADRALYAAKASGRNQVVHFQTLPDRAGAVQ